MATGTLFWIIILAIIIVFHKTILRFLGFNGYKKTTHPPRWVVKTASRFKWAGVNQYIKLKGKHYRYKVFCVGQGQFEYYKKRRGK